MTTCNLHSKADLIELTVTDAQVTETKNPLEKFSSEKEDKSGELDI